ncbi:hypothetical protein ACJQWK_08655 [Exserohilum turcicum]|uniref:Uncharacterized protein n=1 Tax=Exserohilum turcicum (strain 28A) TaxID=671987 RepID=R0K3B2_EXST2|nr:uncharacterized protein SETTUDRAFT_169000 [Exserohilum turcica Et28A]EOA87573.1 hypothetical protein SETTUDRAFT_169000 [Exserohilum turcica Et28A]
MSSNPSTVNHRRTLGFADLPLEVRNRIYAICAYDKDRLVEKEVSRRNAATTSDAFWEVRGYYSLTQASRQTRKEFRPLYLKDRAISVHIRDAEDYLEAIYPTFGHFAIARDAISIWLTIRTEVERRGKYDTPIEIRPLLLRLFNTPGLDFEFFGKGGSVFNELFLGYESEWRAAVNNELKSVELKEPSLFGMKLVLDPKCPTYWIKQCAISVTRLPHVPEEALEWFSSLGLDTENDMIFVRRGAPKWLRGDFMRASK